VLFHLIRQNRLEWRAELSAWEVTQLQVGFPVKVMVAGVGEIDGKVRIVSPSVDPVSRNALVYVELPDAMQRGFRSGMFAQGKFNYGESEALLLPQDAVLLREGFHYVYVVKVDANALAKVELRKVVAGDLVGDKIAILQGLAVEETVVSAGGAFLTDGDWVKVVAE
jgi:RND family efflux transporter MFP subunit